MTLNHERVQLGQLVGAIVADLETLVNENNATLTHEIAPDLPTIHADPAFLRRVFENLITNALHHNPPGLHITLQAILQENWIHCTVQDNGVGMSQSESESLFERYAQGSRNRRSAGLGLGLYLCRQIITAHGGQIGVTSTPGAGATFWFTLPIAEV
jgi:signal transduction histidine kinase